MTAQPREKNKPARRYRRPPLPITREGVLALAALSALPSEKRSKPRG